jgi:hypothetical protein
MNTDRISIINQDQSFSQPSAEDTTLGFTVVLAEKGSATPLYIPPSNQTKILESIGYSSAEYPLVQELLDFNASHGVYVSSPYNEAAANKVAAAYVSAAGIFRRDLPVDLTGMLLESVAEEDAAIPGINSFSADPSILVPVGLNNSLFAHGTDIQSSDLVTYTIGATSKLTVALGCNISPSTGELSTGTSKLHFLNTGAFSASEPGRVMRRSHTNAIIVVDIEGVESPLELHLVADGVNIDVTDPSGNIIGKILPSGSNILALELDSSFTRGAGLSGLYVTYFSASALATTWASESFRSRVKFYWKASLNKNQIKAAIYSKTPTARNTLISFPRQPLGNKISFTVSEKISPNNISSRTITGSIDETEEDGFKAPLGFKLKLANQDFVSVVTLDTFNSNTIYTATGTAVAPTLTLAPVLLSRGVRISSSADLEKGWAEAQSPEFDNVDIFFKCDALDNTPTLFTQLSSTHKLARFTANRLVTPEQATQELPALSYGNQYYIITNAWTRKSPFTREDMAVTLIGAYAKMIAKILDYKDGGAAPMFLNASGLGGQLEGLSDRPKPAFKYTAAQLTNLDNANYNPVIRDSTHGIMVTSQKTAAGGELSDWSYVGHSSAFLKFQRQVRDRVMFPQIGKPNNPYYRTMRATQVESLLRSRLEGPSRIWAAGVVDTIQVNNTDTLSQRKFKIAVMVKVDIFSEGVELVFTNVGQSVEL